MRQKTAVTGLVGDVGAEDRGSISSSLKDLKGGRDAGEPTRAEEHIESLGRSWDIGASVCDDAICIIQCIRSGRHRGWIQRRSAAWVGRREPGRCRWTSSRFRLLPPDQLDKRFEFGRWQPGARRDHHPWTADPCACLRGCRPRRSGGLCPDAGGPGWWSRASHGPRLRPTGGHRAACRACWGCRLARGLRHVGDGLLTPHSALGHVALGQRVRDGGVRLRRRRDGPHGRGRGCLRPRLRPGVPCGHWTSVRSLHACERGGQAADGRQGRGRSGRQRRLVPGAASLATTPP